MEEQSPCDNCEKSCDSWEAQYCCTLCQWYYGDAEPPCDECDPRDI